MRYRADIDGLRAVAVLAVVLFHAHWELFSGGFVGVDVFFVISGYLITQVITADIAAGRFSVAYFYERRIRRLFPALFLVFGAVSVAGYGLLMPGALDELGQSVVAATLFASNALFYLEAGYFDAPGLTKPLLHTWSLAVEEQFYIVYPIVLFALLRWLRRGAVGMIAIAAGVSFAVGAWTVSGYPDAAFYLAPFRAWELFLGALLALNAVPYAAGRWFRELLAWAGLALVLFAVFTYSSSTAFPGLAALAPCLGTAMIIHAGAAGGNALGRILSARWVVFVGLISYSLYLWHWPVLVYAEYYLIRPPTTAETAGLILGSFLLAVFSWRFVEQPFRRRRLGTSRRALFGGAAAAMALFIAVGVTGYLSRGFPQRIPLVAQDYARAGEEEHTACYTESVEEVTPDGLCRIGVSGAESGALLLWGDSHAAAIAPGVHAAATSAGTHGWLAVQSGCPPLLGVTRSGADAGYNCGEFNERVVEFVLENGITTVILASRWSVSLEPRPEREKRAGLQDVYIVDEQSDTPSEAENLAAFTRGLGRTLERLEAMGVTAWLVEEVPYVGYDTPSALARMVFSGRRFDTIAPNARGYEAQRAPLHRTLDQLIDRHELRLIDPGDELCPPTAQLCRVTHAGHSLYTDDDHLSRYGAELLQHIFQRAVADTTATVPAVEAKSVQ